MKIGHGYDLTMFSHNLSRAGKDWAARNERLSTGLRINHGADDPSGMGIATGMKAWTGGTRAALQNTQEALDMLKVQDAGLREVSEILLRMRDIAVRGANQATLSEKDKERLTAELNNLSAELTRTAEGTVFQGRQPLLGTPMTTNADLEIEMEWNTQADLDLHVFEPGALPIGSAAGPGEHIYYNNTNINSQGGQLDVDDNNGIDNGYWAGVTSTNRVFYNVPTNPAQEHYIAGTGDAYSGTYTICIDRWISYQPAYRNVDTDYTIRVYRWRGTPYEDVTEFTGFIPAEAINPSGVYASDWADAGSGIENVAGQDDPLSDFDAIVAINWAPLMFPEPVYLQAGAANEDVYSKSIQFFDATADTLGVATLDVSSTASAGSSLESIDTAIGYVSDYMDYCGSAMINLETIVDDLTTEIINTEASRSTIEDADMAEEITKMTIAGMLSSMAGRIFPAVHDEVRMISFLVKEFL